VLVYEFYPEVTTPKIMLLWQLVLSFATIVLMGGYSPLLLAQEEGKQGGTTPSLTSE